MPTFGNQLTASVWKDLRAARALSTVTFTTVTQVFDPATGDVTTTTTASTVAALVSPFRPDEIAALGVARQDRKVLFPQAAVSSPPDIHTRLTMDGVEWHMHAPPELVSNASLWQLQVRRIGDV